MSASEQIILSQIKGANSKVRLLTPSQLFFFAMQEKDNTWMLNYPFVGEEKNENDSVKLFYGVL